jgi:hypothetical protein
MNEIYKQYGDAIELYKQYEDAVELIVNVSVRLMLHNKHITSPEHEWLCFNNQLELIRNNVMERLEREDYFK